MLRESSAPPHASAFYVIDNVATHAGRIHPIVSGVNGSQVKARKKAASSDIYRLLVKPFALSRKNASILLRVQNDASNRSAALPTKAQA